MAQEHAQRDQRLKAWKQSIMNHDLGGLSRWIKGKEKDQRSVTLTDNNHVAATRQEAINLIKNYWTRIWEKQTAEAPSAEELPLP